MGVSYNGGSPLYRSILDNLVEVRKSFKYENGYFGEKGKNRQVRVIYGDNPVMIAEEFYKKITNGGKVEMLPNGKGKITRMPDGSVIVFRRTTKSDDNPAVNIDISKSTDSGDIKTQKIHFEKRRNKK